MTIAPGLRRWLAFGHGVGMEITGPAGAETLRVAVAKVRPGGAREIATLVLDDISQQAAAAWGAQYSAFARKHGASHVPVAVVLPRRDVIVRQLTLPGVSDADLASAVSFQLDGLHPYPDSDAVANWSRIPGTSLVLVAITRRSVMERHLTSFAEAGIPVASLTCSAAAVYSALHLWSGAKSRGDVLVSVESGSGFEIYGESGARPLFSAYFEASLERAAALASAELRLSSPDLLAPLSRVLASTSAIAYAAALCSACPHLALSMNLLPEENRGRSARAAWIPAAALAAIVVMLAGGLAALPRIEKNQYLKSLEAEIAKVEPVANRSVALDRQIAQASSRISLLTNLRTRTRADMDVLAELTKILPPPTWVNLLELNQAQVTLAGETVQTAPLLKVLDESPFFEASEFVQSPARVNGGVEAFRIRVKREAGK